jgi:pimeloyl-ACP methyl ester carboxylesterase
MLVVVQAKKVEPVSDPHQDKNNPEPPKSMLKSTSRLVIDALISMTDVVESMHQRISPLSKSATPVGNERGRGISGLVYNSIRSITALVGKSLDKPLALIEQQMEQSPPSQGGQALISALNGILGDHLVKRESHLALPMTLRLDDQQLDYETLAKSIQQSQGKLLIMVHGLCMNDLQWTHAGHNHGKRLANELDYALAYLRYNSGQHISDNGKAFSQVLENVLTHALAHDNMLRLDISIIGHSMGGLVSRSAYHEAQALGHKWPDYCENLFFLGSPLHGAPLEKAGNWLDMLLGIHQYTAPLKRLTQIRSAGITDLRHGNILETDWQTRNRFDFSRDKRTPLPLPPGVKCYALASTIAAQANKIGDQLIGDGLVPLDSALGRHENKVFNLHFPVERQWVGRDINHMQLLSNTEVYRAIKNWLASE